MHSLSHPFFSIIITVYNKREYLTRCLNSLVHLNANYEVIIIDDCSQDGSVAIAKEYAARNTFFRLIELGSNHDVSHARNLGVSEAQGEYILFADGDDWFTVGSLDTVEQLLERNDYPQVGIFAYKRYTNFNYENTITFTRHLNSRKHLINANRTLDLYANSKLCASPWNKVFQRQYWIDGGFQWPNTEELYSSLLGSEDFAILPYAICKAEKTLISDFDFYNYNVNVSSKSATGSLENIKASLYSGYSLADKFAQDEEFKEQSNINIHGLVFSHFRYVFNLNKHSISKEYIQLFFDMTDKYIETYSVQVNKYNRQSIQRFYRDIRTACDNHNYTYNAPRKELLRPRSKSFGKRLKRLLKKYRSL